MNRRNVLLYGILTILIVASLFVPQLPVGNTPAVTTGFPDTIQRILPSIVHIKCDQWQGSGVAVSKDIVVTARHVIDGSNYTITTSSGAVIKGTQAISHKDYDIGFIKIEIPKELKEAARICNQKLLVPAKFGSIEDCVLGQSIFIVGSPYGKINFNSVTLGIISGLERDWDSLSRCGESYGWKIAFTTDSGAHPGNSGGPVFTLDGIVRGLLVGGYSPVLNCSMPCDLFLSDIETIQTMFLQNKYQIEKSDPYENWINE